MAYIYIYTQGRIEQKVVQCAVLSPAQAPKIEGERLHRGARCLNDSTLYPRASAYTRCEVTSDCQGVPNQPA